MKFQHLPILIILLFLLCSYYLGYTPLMVSLVFLGASLLAYMAYSRDKSAAQNGEWRVSENTLHLYSLLCGWPGAIMAQQKLRHKTKKVSFRVVFWLTVVMNAGFVSWLHTQQGSRLLHVYTYKLENVLVGVLGKGDAARTLLLFTRFRVHR